MEIEMLLSQQVGKHSRRPASMSAAQIKPLHSKSRNVCFLPDPLFPLP